MSDNKPPEDVPEDVPDEQPDKEKKREDESKKNSNIPTPQSLLPIAQADQKIEAAFKDLPPQDQTRIKEIFRETFMGIVQSTNSPKITPEIAKILSASVDKDNQLRFDYLSQKQKDQAEYRKTAHRDRVRLIWPILVTTIIIVLGGIVVGIYLAATGHDVLGSNILTAVLTGLFAFLAGIGVANFFKEEKDN